MKKFAITYTLMSKRTRRRLGKSKTEVKEYPDYFTAENAMERFESQFVPTAMVRVVDVRELSE